MSWPLFPVLPPCSPNSQAPEQRARCCSRRPPLGGARARLPEPRPSPLPLPVPLSPTAPAPGPRLPAPCSVATSADSSGPLQESVCHPGPRDLLLLHLLQRKGQHRWVWGRRCARGEGRRRRQPVALSLEPGAPWLSWAGQAAGSPDAEHHPSSAVNWCVIVGKYPLSLGLTPCL